MKKILVTFVLLFCVNYALYSGDESNVESVEEKKDQFVYPKQLEDIPEFKVIWDKHCEVVSKFIWEYEKVLDAELDKAKKKGDLKLIDKIQNETIKILKYICSGSASQSFTGWKKNEKLASAVKKYNTSAKKEMASFVKSLDSVIVDLTKSGDVAKAKQVQEYKDYIIKEDITSRLCDGSWAFNMSRSKIQVYTRDFVMTMGDSSARWEITEEYGVRVIWKRGNGIHSMTFLDEKTMLFIDDKNRKIMIEKIDEDDISSPTGVGKQKSTTK